MDWLPALLKHLSIARSAIVALLVASAAMYFGPRIAPTYIDSPPKEWSAVVGGIFVFSACLVTLWGSASAWAVIQRVGSALNTKLSARRLNNLERKGLVRVNSYIENLVSLSEGGRKRALELQRQSKTNVT
jgi:hypothetical protein